MHTAGERIFVDFAGHAMEVIDGATGEVRRAEIFVAVLGASSYTFAEATWTQSLPDWIAAHVAMLAFIGGAPRQIISDNLRAGITRACFYEPLVALMPIWRRTTAPQWFRHGRTSRATRPRWKSAFQFERGVLILLGLDQHVVVVESEAARHHPDGSGVRAAHHSAMRSSSVMGGRALSSRAIQSAGAGRSIAANLPRRPSDAGPPAYVPVRERAGV